MCPGVLRIQSQSRLKAGKAPGISGAGPVGSEHEELRFFDETADFLELPAIAGGIASQGFQCVGGTKTADGQVVEPNLHPPTGLHGIGVDFTDPTLPSHVGA